MDRWAGCCSTIASSWAPRTTKRARNARYRDEYVWLARDHEFNDSAAHARQPSVMTRVRARPRRHVLEQPGVAVGQPRRDQRSFNRRRPDQRLDLRATATASPTLSAPSSRRRSADYDYARLRDSRPGGRRGLRPRDSPKTCCSRCGPKVFTLCAYTPRTAASGNPSRPSSACDSMAQHYEPGRRSHAGESTAEPALRLERSLARVRSVGRFSPGPARRGMARRRSAADGRLRAGVHPLHPRRDYEPSTAARWGVEAYSKRWTTDRAVFRQPARSVVPAPDLQPDRIRIAPDESEAAGLELSARHDHSPIA